MKLYVLQVCILLSVCVGCTVVDHSNQYKESNVLRQLNSEGWSLPLPKVTIRDNKISVTQQITKSVKKVTFLMCVDQQFDNVADACRKIRLSCKIIKRNYRTKNKIELATGQTLYYGMVAKIEGKKKTKLFGGSISITSLSNPTTAPADSRVCKNTTARLECVSHIYYHTARATSSVLLNPGRGFYHYTETKTSSYSALDEGQLEDFREIEKTIIYRVFVLDTFAEDEISSDILERINDDFNTIRAGKIKVIVRFCYTLDRSGDEWYEADLPHLLNHISQLGPILTEHSDVILVLQAGFIGVWGEWYYTTHYGNPNTGGATAEDWLKRQQIVQTLLDNTPESMQIQVRTPKIKKLLIGRTTPVTSSEAHGNTSIARLGHHNDCFLSSDTDYGTYEDKEEDYEYLMQETEYLAMGGETCHLNPPRSDCDTALTELSGLHFTYINSIYHPDVLQSWKDQGCYSDIGEYLGYNLVRKEITIPTAVAPGETFCITIVLSNIGYSAPLTSYLVQVVFKDGSEVIGSTEVDSDSLLWNPGSSIILNVDVAFGNDFVAGGYEVYLRISDAYPKLRNIPEYRILLTDLDDEDLNSDRDNYIGIIKVQ